MNINPETYEGKNVLILGSQAPELVPDYNVDDIISVGIREGVKTCIAEEAKGYVQDREVYCFMGPNCIKGINKVARDTTSALSLKRDHLVTDLDLAALNYALLAGARNIHLIGIRDPHSREEDQQLADFLMEYYPHIVINCENEKWVAFSQCVLHDDEPDYTFTDPIDEEELDVAMQGRAAIVCCYRSGGDFDACPREYVHKLYQSCAKHISRKLSWDMFVITDCPGLFQGMSVKPITMSTDLPRWHCKFEIFRTELWREYSTVVCMDLDTIVVGDINNVLTANIEFGMLSDIYRPERPATGMIVFHPNPRLRYIYEYILEHRPDPRTWDVYPMLTALEHLGITPERLQHRFGIYSWKADLHDRNGRWQQIPYDAQIVVWHGKPRPHSVKWEVGAKEKAPEVEWVCIPQMQEPRTIYIIGGGPSLKKNNPDDHLNRSDCVIAVNDAYQYECASALLFADISWWKVHRSALEEWNGRIWTTAAIPDDRLQHIKREKSWLSKRPDAIAWNACTGWAALNMALLAGADRIVLLGFDMQFDENGAGNYHRNIRRLKSNTFECFRWREVEIARHVKEMFRDVEIVVCEPTALTAWRTMPMADAVAWGREPRQKPRIEEE